jgi:hypothetical protein
MSNDHVGEDVTNCEYVKKLIEYMKKTSDVNTKNTKFRFNHIACILGICGKDRNRGEFNKRTLEWLRLFDACRNGGDQKITSIVVEIKEEGNRLIRYQVGRSGELKKFKAML